MEPLNRSSITARLVTLLIVPQDRPQETLSHTESAAWQQMIEQLLAMQVRNAKLRESKGSVAIPVPERIFVTESLQIPDLLTPIVTAMPRLEVLPVSSAKFDILKSTSAHEAFNAMRILHNEMVRANEHYVFVMCYRWLPAQLQKWDQSGAPLTTSRGQRIHQHPLLLNSRFLTYVLAMERTAEGHETFSSRLIQIYQIP